MNMKKRIIILILKTEIWFGDENIIVDAIVERLSTIDHLRELVWQRSYGYFGFGYEPWLTYAQRKQDRKDIEFYSARASRLVDILDQAGYDSTGMNIKMVHAAHYLRAFHEQIER